jgi:hypothetical protein
LEWSSRENTTKHADAVLCLHSASQKPHCKEGVPLHRRPEAFTPGILHGWLRGSRFAAAPSRFMDTLLLCQALLIG